MYSNITQYKYTSIYQRDDWMKPGGQAFSESNWLFRITWRITSQQDRLVVKQSSLIRRKKFDGVPISNTTPSIVRFSTVRMSQSWINELSCFSWNDVKDKVFIPRPQGYSMVYQKPIYTPSIVVFSSVKMFQSWRNKCSCFS